MEGQPGAAVIGTGFIGPVHVEALRRLGIPVVGLLGSRPERGQQAAERLGVPRAYASLDELLADQAVAVVHITSPNDLHFEQARRSLEAGKHVICEKPLAITSAQTAELVSVAARSGRVAAVNYNVRYYPLAVEARERVRRGDLGEVLHVSGAYVQDWLLLESDFNWRDPGYRGHRHALAGPAAVHCGPTRAGGVRRSGHLPARAPEAQRPGGDVQWPTARGQPE